MIMEIQRTKLSETELSALKPTVSKEKNTADDPSAEIKKKYEPLRDLLMLSDNNPHTKSNSIIYKFNSGKKLSFCEMKYLEKHSPDACHRIKSTMYERAALERRMKNSRTKSEARMTSFCSIMSAGKGNPDAGSGIARVNQLVSARNEYLKSRDYKKKKQQ